MAKKFSRQNLQKFLVDNLDHNSDEFSRCRNSWRLKMEGNTIENTIWNYFIYRIFP